ncbi:hypothetical protein A6U87_14090 [Rhizobium sp. AC44/96]|nr:hypothetical protein A6U87_14090 [Rhizobium sp. AC44/96]
MTSTAFFKARAASFGRRFLYEDGPLRFPIGVLQQMFSGNRCVLLWAKLNIMAGAATKMR